MTCKYLSIRQKNYQKKPFCRDKKEWLPQCNKECFKPRDYEPIKKSDKPIKQYSKKRAKLERERYSILTNDLNKCYICGAKENIHIHEIYFGKNRQNSMKYGCCVPLCFHHHNGSKHAVHYDKYLDDLLKEECQIKFEKEHSREEFISIFKKSYL